MTPPYLGRAVFNRRRRRRAVPCGLPFDRQVVAGIGETDARLERTRRLALVLVGLPGDFLDLRQFARDFLLSRIEKTVHECAAEFVAFQPWRRLSLANRRHESSMKKGRLCEKDG
jgi:hypothetical protein